MSNKIVHWALGLLVLTYAPTLAQEKSNQKALAIYADAAGFQNNGAFDLAIEEWKKLIDRYPNDPLVSKAQHYLGVSYIQSQDYRSAAEAFRAALKDADLDVREESLINLGWCLFTQARSGELDSRKQREAFAEARKKLDDFLKQYSASSFRDQAYFYLGEIEYTEGNAAKSIQYYKRLIDDPKFKDSPLRADALYAMAVAYEEQKDGRAAARTYRQFLKEQSQHRLKQEVAVRLADLLLADGNSAEAETLLADRAGTGDLADYTLLRLGYALSKQGKQDAAAEKYLELLQRFPGSPHAPTAAISVGQAFYQAGKLDQAVEQFRKALASKDEVAADAAHWIAITYSRQGKSAEAKQLLEDALKWSKDNVTLQMDYADALYNTPDEMAKARAAYALIAQNHADHALAPRAAYNAAFASLQLRDFEKAREWSEWFLEKFPRDPLRNDVAYVAAETLLQDGEYKAAAKAYGQLRAADQANPSNDLWSVRQAMALYLDGQYAPAIELVEKSLRQFKEPAQKAEALYILGASLHYEEQYEKAIQRLQESRSTNAKWESADEVLLLLAEALQRTDQVEEAKKTLQELIKQYPQSRLKAQAEYRLGQMSASTGDLDAAIRQYRGILQNPEASSFHSFARYGVAWCEMQQEEYGSALKELERVAQDISGGSIAGEVQLARGVCLRKLGETSKAIQVLEAFVDTRPQGVSLGNALYELGLAYTDQGKLQEANGVFLRLLKDVSNYPSKEQVYYDLAWNFQELRDTQSAERYFTLLAQEYPESEFSGEATYMIAQQLYEKGKYSEAARVYGGVIDKTRSPALLEKTYYKLGWSLFQQEDFERAQKYFSQQSKSFPQGELVIDALFMGAECQFKQNKYGEALEGYRKARQALETRRASNSVASQVQTLIYLHGAQCLREAGEWEECESWLQVVVRDHSESSYLSTALYELAFCKQKQDQLDEAIKLYAKVAEDYNYTEVGARSRFMMGEIYFGKREFEKAIPEFQRVMYGFGGDRASDEIKNWQVKSAFEAARCSEILIDSLGGAAREKIIATAQEFYSFIVNKHAAHNLAAQAKTRLNDLQKLR